MLCKIMLCVDTMVHNTYIYIYIYIHTIVYYIDNNILYSIFRIGNKLKNYRFYI
jgi:hypothetical protein